MSSEFLKATLRAAWTMDRGIGAKVNGLPKSTAPLNRMTQEEGSLHPDLSGLPSPLHPCTSGPPVYPMHCPLYAILGHTAHFSPAIAEAQPQARPSRRHPLLFPLSLQPWERVSVTAHLVLPCECLESGRGALTLASGTSWSSSHGE